MVDALSATLFNMTADRIYVAESGNIYIPEGTNPLAVFDAFGCINTVIEHAKKRFVCFIAQTSDELAVEPRSIYNYAIPVFADHVVVNKIENPQFFGYIFQGNIKFDLQRKRSYINEGLLLPLGKKCYDCLVKGAYFFDPDMSNFEEILISCVPLLVSLYKWDDLSELVAKTLSENERKELSLLVGESL
jgi:hypothetical protein